MDTEKKHEENKISLHSPKFSTLLKIRNSYMSYVDNDKKNPELKVFLETYVLFQHYAFLLSYFLGLSIKNREVEDILE